MSVDSRSIPDEEVDLLFKVNSIEYFEVVGSNYDNDLNKILKQIPTVYLTTFKPIYYHSIDNFLQDEHYKEGLIYIVKILENILLNPANLKSRRIRKCNKFFVTYISSNELLLELFTLFGFVPVEDSYVLQHVYFHRLLSSYLTLVKTLHGPFNLNYKSLQSHFFDPFKAYSHYSNINSNSDSFELTSKDETKSIIDDTVKEISEKDESESKLDDWNPVITVESNVKPGKKLQPEPLDTSKPTASSLIKMYNIGKNENFESRSKKQLETLKSKSELAKKSPIVEVKIKFPKSTTLTVQVPVKSLVRNIRRNIQTILVDDVSFDDWHLVEFPIRRKIRDEKTLLEEDIVLKSILHFTFAGITFTTLHTFRFHT
ncbi:uncharacterized protein TA05180 [Theileria annulata]|uniref:PUB domain-containing protein n=1 Tax=Theileria annulata TaxID=5874 RepID=Q4UBN1_THEAN|nr:uncharacterized protein TA05180 [Theileria annulata]CAI75770.1 hypothetical protein TA05180 [Theileria annulata]|eukprot:XP_955246.1 hypothetical protein TA05180 [Theileria annulata]